MEFLNHIFFIVIVSERSLSSSHGGGFKIKMFPTVTDTKIRFGRSISNCGVNF